MSVAKLLVDEQIKSLCAIYDLKLDVIQSFYDTLLIVAERHLNEPDSENNHMEERLKKIMIDVQTQRKILSDLSDELNLIEKTIETQKVIKTSDKLNLSDKSNLCELSNTTYEVKINDLSDKSDLSDKLPVSENHIIAEQLWLQYYQLKKKIMSLI